MLVTPLIINMDEINGIVNGYDKGPENKNDKKLQIENYILDTNRCLPNIDLKIKEPLKLLGENTNRNVDLPQQTQHSVTINNKINTLVSDNNICNNEIELGCSVFETDSSLLGNCESCINDLDNLAKQSLHTISYSEYDLPTKIIMGTDENVSSDNVSAIYSSLQLENLKKEIIDRESIIKRLENERDQLQQETSHNTCRSQLDQLQKEIQLHKQEHDLDKRTNSTLKLEIESLQNQYEIANKERETIVMRYASSEMEVINQRKELENFEKKYKESVKDRETLSFKLKNASAEKSRISQLLDVKCCDFENMQKDVEKLKDELNSKDIKIKWTQNKLKSEIENHKESEVQVEKLSNTILEAKEEVEKAKKDAEVAIKQFQCSQENRAYVLEQQLKEVQAQIILERHSGDERENNNKQLMREVESQLVKQLLLIDENNALKLKVASLEKERHEQAEVINHLRESLSKSSVEVDQLQHKTSTLDNLALQLIHEQERMLTLQGEMAQLKPANEELVSEIAGCREREAEMLEFTQKVTAKNVRLQSEFSCLEAKARQLEFEEEPLHRKIKELTKNVDTLNKELEKERSDRNEEKKLVARHLAEKTAKIENLTRELEDLKGENQVMKHKHATAIREVNREVAQFRRRLDQPELSSSGSDCMESRASSCTSLPDAASTRFQLEPDKQSMVDRILRLQRENVRLREKMDFLEEHSKQLVAELQKKTRVLQSYILREEAGTLTSGSMDFNKAELSKHGGIMASVYTTKPVDDSMTLELSLEINQKLQAILEDTLLKNITLKENIDTLGDEIRRLSKK